VLRLFSEIPDVKVSEKSIYKIIYQYGPITKNGILTHLHSSLTTISRFIDSLEKNDLIRIHNQETAGGRNPVEYVINPTACYAFGAYISADVYGIGLCDIAGNIVEKTSFLFQEPLTPSEIADVWAQFVTRVIAEQQVDPEKIAGIGVSVEGPILKEKGIIYHSYHLSGPGWDLVPIKDLVEMKTGYPTWVDCIVETALLSELVYGPHTGCSSAAYLRIDKGIGCAIYLNGVLGIGREDFAYSLGHSVIDFKGRPCFCGRRGCLETYGSMDAIVADIKAIKPEIDVAAAETTLSESEVWDYSPILRPVEACQFSHDPPLQHYFEELVEVFAVAISNFLYFTRPRVLFLTGRTVNQLSGVFEQVIERIQQEYHRNPAEELQFADSELNDTLVIKGSSFVVFNNYLQFFGKDTRP
jgi:predicted NBD/HSP70 family sugar kinase